MADYSAFAEREASGWRDAGIVDAYVTKFGPVTDQIAAELVSRAAPESKTVLDLCCGQGTLTAMLTAQAAKTVGLDFSPDMLARAAQAAPGAELEQGDAAALPFETSSFDVVLCNFGIMHLPDQPAALKEVCRVLKPDGRFLMATWMAPDRSPAFGTVFGAFKANADMAAAPAQPDIFTFSRPDEAKKLMRDAGLELIAHETVTPAWILKQPDDLFDIFLTGTVAASQLLKSQTPEIVEVIRKQITATVAEKFASGDGYRVPVPVAVLTAEPA
jgi:ubiquinone/menaquinone biosynthesis C-methylase UbiE